ELLRDLRVLVGFRLEHRKVRGECRFLQRIGLRARLFGGDIDADDIVSALQQRFENGLAEGLLAVNDDTHAFLPGRLYAAFSFFSGALSAPDALISAISLALNFSTSFRISSVCSPSSGERFTSEIESDILIGLPTLRYLPRVG